METKETINNLFGRTLLDKLKLNLEESNQLIEQLNNLGIDFNRKDGSYDFSIDPKNINGQLMETIYAHQITDKNIEHEAKSEHISKWMKSGNMYIEYAQQKNNVWVPSGISITKASVWVHILKDFDNKMLIPIPIPTDYLLKRIEYLLSIGLCRKSGKVRTDDGTATKGYLLPLQYLYITPNEIGLYPAMERKIISVKMKNK